MQNDLDNNAENRNHENEGNNFKTITKSILANFLDFNFDVIKCYNLVLDLKVLKSNIGFYSLLILFVLQIIILIVYISKKLKSLKYYMIHFNNKLNNKNNNKVTSNNINKKYINKNNGSKKILNNVLKKISLIIRKLMIILKINLLIII